MYYGRGRNLIRKLVGWGNTPNEPAFGASNDAASVKGKLVNLISSVRTLMRSEISPSFGFFFKKKERKGVVMIIVPFSCEVETGWSRGRR